MTTLRLERTWGSDTGRLPAAFTTAVLTNDPAVAWVFAPAAMRAIDTRTGEVLREHALPELVCDGRRVVVSCAGDDGAVLVGAVDGDGAVVHLLTLADGAMRPLFRTPWRFTKLDRIAADPRVIVDGGTIVDPRDDAWSRRNEQRWFSRDLRWCVREELGATDERGEIIVRLWFSEVATGNEWELGTTTRRGVDAAFSADGKRFWRIMDRPGRSPGYECWELDARSLAQFRSHGVGSQFAALSTTGDVAFAPGEVEMYMRRPMRDGASWIAQAACVSPDGRRFAQSRLGVLCIMDLATGVETSFCDAHQDAVIKVTWSPSGALAASTDGATEVILWSTMGEPRWNFEAEGAVFALAFSPDERTLYGVVNVFRGTTSATTLCAWDVVEGCEITPSWACDFLIGSRHLCVDLLLSPDGTRALLTGPGGRGHGPQWIDLATWRSRDLWADTMPVGSSGRSDGCLSSFGGFSADGTTAWTLSRVEPPSLWHLTLLDGHGDCVFQGIPWTPEPVAAGFERLLSVTKLERGELLLELRHIRTQTVEHRWESRHGMLEAAVVGPTLCALGDAEGTVHLLDPAHTTPIATKLPGSIGVTALALSRDERRLLVGAADGRVHLYAIDPSPDP